MQLLKRYTLVTATLMLALAVGSGANAIDIVLDYSFDDNNEGWFSGSPEGLARRASVDAAAGFLSAILTNDDWNAISVPNENLSFFDIAASTLNDLNGNPVAGSPESDGQGFKYTFDLANLSTVAANEYVLYVGAFAFDTGTSSHAKASSDSSDRRNAAGFAGEEFNTWGGKIYFDSSDTWYSGQNPGIDPTDDYGIQDPDKSPTGDITTDNWDWHTTSLVWKGFDLTTIDSVANGRFDLYAVALHEMLHALGASSTNFGAYVGQDAGADHLLGPHVVAEFGGPVPRADTGHFDFSLQSEVWDSDGIISEVTLDPNSLRARRKYLTKLDAALLRDLGYEVLSSFATASLADFNSDTLVNGADLAIWQAGYGLDGSGDANGNSLTDGTDLLIWQREFAPGEETLSTASPVPEPTSLFLLTIAGTIAWLKKKSPHTPIRPELNRSRLISPSLSFALLPPFAKVFFSWQNLRIFAPPCFVSCCINRSFRERHCAKPSRFCQVVPVELGKTSGPGVGWAVPTRIKIGSCLELVGSAHPTHSVESK